MTSSAVDTVRAWLDAANAGDADAAVAVTWPDVVIAGPRGATGGHAVLRDWIAYAGATFATRAVYASGDTVVVAQRGLWRDAATGEVKGEMDVATRFRVAGGRVAEVERYGDLAAALAAGGLSMDDAAGGEPG